VETIKFSSVQHLNVDTYCVASPHRQYNMIVVVPWWCW